MTRAAIIAALIVTAIGGGGAVAQPGSATVDPLVLGAPEVSAAASPSEVRLGQPITLVITATYGTGVTVNLPDPLVLGDAFETGHRESSDRVRSDGHHVREWQVKVYPWELGELEIPAVQVTFTAGGKAGSVAGNAVPVRIVGVLGDADDPKLMRAMAPPVPLWRRDWMLAFYATLVVVVVIGVARILVRTRRRRRPARGAVAVAAASPIKAGGPQEGAARDDGDAAGAPAIAPPPVYVPPPPTITTRARRKLDRLGEEALARLRAIEASGRLDSDRRGAYREMVEVIRDYLGARFTVAAAELTTRELCQALTLRSTEAAGLTGAWLADCDLVKYANRSASVDEARTILDGACGLVDRTTPGHRGEVAHA